MNENFSKEPLTKIKVKKNPIIRLIKLIIWIFIIIGIGIYYSYSNFKTNILIIENKTITVNEGDTIEDIGETLGLNKYYLKYYMNKNHPDFELLAGDFTIEENSKIENILESLQNPIIPDEVDITILEGWNIYDVENYLTNKGYTEENFYINYVTSLEKIEKLTEFFPFIEGLTTLEGFLYPDTYKVNGNDLKINNLVIAQLENFENKIYNELLLDENGVQKFTNKEIEEIVNLASIVEKEEKNKDEKSTVAGILKKRLDEGWMIGADITVCYPHEWTGEECKMNISEYINEISEYNTRTKTGLPKTPIGNPNFETIEATINSKETPYYFYLHNTKTGQIYYGKSNREHEANKRFMD